MIGSGPILPDAALIEAAARVLYPCSKCGGDPEAAKTLHGVDAPCRRCDGTGIDWARMRRALGG